MAVKKTTAKKAAKVATPVTAPVQAEENVVETVKVEETTVEAVKEEKVEEKKTTAKKTTTKKAVKTTLYVQAAGKEVSVDEAIARVKDAWKATGNKVGDLKELAVYVKPEEDAIYYVANGEVTGKVEF